MEQPTFKLLDFLVVAEFSQALLLIFILLIMDKNRKANLFFAVFLFILSANFFSFFLFNSGIRVLPAIFASISIPGISTAGVFIYLYALFVTGLIEKFSKRHLLHFIVYLVNLIFFIIIIYNVDGEPKHSPEFRNSIFFILSTGLVNSIAYILYTIIILKRYYHRIENYYSDLEKMSLNWLLKITPLAFFSLTFWCLSFWLSHLDIIPKSPMSMAGNIIFPIIIIFITAYHVINQPEIFKKNIEMSHEIDEEESQTGIEKYAKQNIDEKMQGEYLALLTAYMDEHKPYLDENITIKDLAEGVKIPSHHLSIVINNRLNKNFYTFINEYRIKEAAGILDDPENSEASIIAIAFKSGFNSKSTFNSVFKKIKGQTPSEYRSRTVFKSELAS
jgi:AraC-like DNA-binding protein